jgi:hypothetical protein
VKDCIFVKSRRASLANGYTRSGVTLYEERQQETNGVPLGNAQSRGTENGIGQAGSLQYLEQIGESLNGEANAAARVLTRDEDWEHA